MKLKEGVDCKGVNPKVWEALWKVDVIYLKYGNELVITSLKEGKHSKKRSSHYRGDAADTRIWYFNTDILLDVVNEIKNELGDDFVVVLESNHIHIHWSPIYHGN